MCSVFSVVRYDACSGPEGVLSKRQLPPFTLVTARYRFAINLNPSDFIEFNLEKIKLLNLLVEIVVF